MQVNRERVLSYEKYEVLLSTWKAYLKAIFWKSGFPGGTDKFVELRAEAEERKKTE